MRPDCPSSCDDDLIEGVPDFAHGDEAAEAATPIELPDPEVPEGLPNSVRYVKNGRGGCWWKAAKDNNQIHAGWSNIPRDLLLAEKTDRIWNCIRERINRDIQNPGAAQRDFKALRYLLDNPSQHIWVTFEDGCMWWCTVQNRPQMNPEGESQERGHFWLRCNRPWSHRSLGGRDLATANLPGAITAASGFRGTVCEPGASEDILRIIFGGKDPDAEIVAEAHKRYVSAIANVVSRLHERDFELLIDLILARSGWARVATLGGNTEGLDIEAENYSINEIAFVQVKSRANQALLDKYTTEFNARRRRYNRMIFAVHTPEGILNAPKRPPVQVWTIDKIASLVVRHGLGEWVANRL